MNEGSGSKSVPPVMKAEEQIAETFLMKCFGEKPIFEPLGYRKAPDFCIGPSAFEVRRLNQQYSGRDGSKSEGLEQASYALLEAVDGELSKIEFLGSEQCFFWSLRFKRPLPDAPGKIARKLASAIRYQYRVGTADEGFEWGNVRLDLIATASKSVQPFIKTGFQDRDSCGWTASIYGDSIGFALKDKIERTRKIAGQFERWTLILVDYIPGGGLLPEYFAPRGLEHFSRVVVISRQAVMQLDWPISSFDKDARGQGDETRISSD